jgi:hypothetical protein
MMRATTIEEASRAWRPRSRRSPRSLTYQRDNEVLWPIYFSACSACWARRPTRTTELFVAMSDGSPSSCADSEATSRSGAYIIRTIDGTAGRELTTPTANGRSAGFDADVDWFASFANTYLVIDGGQRDIGILRDSALLATNTAGTFFESFEAVAHIGGYQGAHVVSSLCASGDSQTPTDISVCSPQGS